MDKYIIFNEQLYESLVVGVKYRIQEEHQFFYIVHGIKVEKSNCDKFIVGKIERCDN